MLCTFWLGDIALFRNTLAASLWSHTYHLYQFRMVAFLGISAYCTLEWNAAFAILESIYSFDSNCKKKLLEWSTYFFDAGKMFCFMKSWPTAWRVSTNGGGHGDFQSPHQKQVLIPVLIKRFVEMYPDNMISPNDIIIIDIKKTLSSNLAVF